MDKQKSNQSGVSREKSRSIDRKNRLEKTGKKLGSKFSRRKFIAASSLLVASQPLSVAAREKREDSTVSEDMSTGDVILGNDSVQAKLNANGNFILKTDSGEELTYPSYTSGLVVNVDGENYSYGSGSLIQETTKESSQVASTTWEVANGIRVTQTVSLSNEAVNFTLNISNTSERTQTVKARYLFDYQVGPQDGAPIYVNGDIITTESRFESPDFDNWQTYDQIPDPTLTGRGTLGTTPDKIEFVAWEDVTDTYEYADFDPNEAFYTPGSNTSPQSDSAGLLYYELGDISPGSSRTITTNYGAGRPAQNNLSQLEQSLNQFQVAAQDLLQTSLAARARLHATLYNELGEGYRTNIVDYLGMRGGEINPANADVQPSLESELDEFFNHLEENAILEGTASELYYFFKEMFGAVDRNASTSEMEAVFENYFMGTADGQESYVTINGSTADELRYAFENDFQEQKATGIEALQTESPPPGVIEDLISVVDDKSDLISSQIQAIDDAYASIIDKVRQGGPINSVQSIAVGPSTKPVWDLCLLPYDDVVGSGLSTALFCDGAWILSNYSFERMSQSVWETAPAGALVNRTISHWVMANDRPLAKSASRIAKRTGLEQSIRSHLHQNIDEFIRTHAGPKIELLSEMKGSPITFIEYLLETLKRDGTDRVSDYLASTDNAGSSLEITEITANDIDESNSISVTGNTVLAKGTGSITVTNNGDREITPDLVSESTGISSHSISGLTPVGLPVTSFIQPRGDIPEIAPEETKTIDIEYTVPVDVMPGLYELNVSIASSPLSTTKTTASVQFSDTDLPEISLDTLGEGRLQQGHSTTHNQSTDQDCQRATFTLSYGGSDLDLHLYDEADNHVGQNYDTGSFENEIPGATATGPDQGVGKREGVRIDDPSGDYSTEVVAVQTGEGGSDYSVSSTQRSELGAVVQISPSEIRSDVMIKSTREKTIAISEIGGFNSINDIEISTSNLTNGDETIPPSKISFSRNDFTVQSGGTETIQVTVQVPQGVSPGMYSGTISIQGIDSMNEETIHKEMTVEFNVTPPELLPGSPVRDIDADGVYEDTNGDGSTGPSDVQTLFANRESPEVQDNPGLFDFNGEGGFSVSDVQALFDQLR